MSTTNDDAYVDTFETMVTDDDGRHVMALFIGEPTTERRLTSTVYADLEEAR